MADGMDAYIASLRLAQPVQSYEAGAHIAATQQSIQQEAQARAFQNTMAIISGNDQARQNDVQNNLAQQRINAGLQEAADRRDIMSAHYAQMAQGRQPVAIPADPNDPFNSSSGGQAAIPYAGATGTATPAAYPAVGRAAEAGAVLQASQPASPLSPYAMGAAAAPEAGMTPYSDAGPSVPGFDPQSSTLPPAGPRVDLPQIQGRPGPMTQPNLATGEVADGSGLLPPINGSDTSPSAPSSMPAPPKMGSPHPTIPGFKMGGDGWYYAPGSMTKIQDVPGPEGSNEIQRFTQKKDVHGRWVIAGPPQNFKLPKAASESKEPWTTDDQGRKFVDGVEVEPTAGRTTAAGAKLWDYKVVGKQPFTPDPQDPTKGTIKSTGGQEIPVTVEGMQQDKAGGISYRFKTQQGDTSVDAQAPEAQARKAKDFMRAMGELGIETKSIRFAKDGSMQPIVSETPPAKPGKTMDNSVGGLRLGLSDDDKTTVDTLLSRIRLGTYTPEEKQAFNGLFFSAVILPGWILIFFMMRRAIYYP